MRFKKKVKVKNKNKIKTIGQFGHGLGGLTTNFIHPIGDLACVEFSKRPLVAYCLLLVAARKIFCIAHAGALDGGH